MRDKRVVLSLLAVLIAVAFCLTGCSASQNVCYYAYFETTAYALIYSPSSCSFFCVQLPLEQILRWGKESGLDSIPIAMRNFVGLKDSGFLLGTSDSLRTVRDILDVLGSEDERKPSGEKRVDTMVQKASVLTGGALADRISQICGQDSAALLKLLAERKPESLFYDAHGFFNSDDLNFSQRYFTSWLEQVLGGNT